MRPSLNLKARRHFFCRIFEVSEAWVCQTHHLDNIIGALQFWTCKTRDSQTVMGSLSIAEHKHISRFRLRSPWAPRAWVYDCSKPLWWTRLLHIHRIWVTNVIVTRYQLLILIEFLFEMAGHVPREDVKKSRRDRAAEQVWYSGSDFHVWHIKGNLF